MRTEDDYPLGWANADAVPARAGLGAPWLPPWPPPPPPADLQSEAPDELAAEALDVQAEALDVQADPWLESPGEDLAAVVSEVSAMTSSIAMAARPIEDLMAHRRSRTPLVVFVCTANRCRSPMAEALCRRIVPGIEVASVGTSVRPGVPVDHALALIAEAGLDPTDHKVRALDPATINRAGLVLCMAREHVRHTAVSVPGSFAKTFTLREFVRRAERVAGRGLGESLPDWVQRVGAGRAPSELLGTSDADDIADPYGKDRVEFERTWATLEDLIRRLAVTGLFASSYVA